VQPPIFLDKQTILSHLLFDHQTSLTQFDILEEIGSTNDYLKQKAFYDLNKLAVCLAESQTAGRGRFNRAWFSPLGCNIYFSACWSVAKNIMQLNGLSLVIALTLIKTLDSLGLTQDILIKWPNDILWLEKKLGGILVEPITENHGATRVIIGIGLNINMRNAAHEEIQTPWTSLNTITGKYYDRNPIVALLINQLFNDLKKFDIEGFAPFIKQWSCYDYLFGKKVQLNLGNQNIEGIALGVNSQGNLLLKSPLGEIVAYSAGEASLHI
jgi:BirA family transcriptional regulator, biotin operon repressor / biotin---[acetyl-CoA-carboxylase] ligase